MTEQFEIISIAENAQKLMPLDAPPAVIEAAGPAAAFASDEFIRGTIRNPHTRVAYERAILKLLSWLEARKIPLAAATPGIIGGYFDEMEGSVPSKKLALAAIRRFFDSLVLRHVLILNPAATVRGERYQAVEGKTPEITKEQARTLLASINAATPAGLRDRAILGVLIYTAARAGAVAKLRLKDMTHDGVQYSLRFAEKGGKSREIPVRHDLEIYIREYLAAASKEEEPKTMPLFRALIRRTGLFTDRALSGTDIWRMVKRRVSDAGLPGQICPHSFRVATVTDLLSQGVALGDVQYLAGYVVNHITRVERSRCAAGEELVCLSVVEHIDCSIRASDLT